MPHGHVIWSVICIIDIREARVLELRRLTVEIFTLLFCGTALSVLHFHNNITWRNGFRGHDAVRGLLLQNSRSADEVSGPPSFLVTRTYSASFGCCEPNHVWYSVRSCIMA